MITIKNSLYEYYIRPGVYPSHSISFSNDADKPIAIIARSDINSTSFASQTYFSISDIQQATQIFGPPSSSNNMISLILAVFQNVSADVIAIPVGSDSLDDYSQAFEILNEAPDTYLIISDNSDSLFLDFFSNFLKKSAASSKEFLGIISLDGSSYDHSLVISTANKINNPRVIIAYPPIYCPYSNLNISNALLCALIAKNTDPTFDLINQKVFFENYPSFSLDQRSISNLLDAGISIFQINNGEIVLLRGMTSNTFKDSVRDFSMANISSISTIDHIVMGIRSSLKSNISNFYTDQISLYNIRTTINCILFDFKRRSFISSYKPPKISLGQDDKSICFIELDFVVIKSIFKIFIHIDVSI